MMVMRNNSFAVVAVFSLLGVLGFPLSSQAQTRCNLMHDLVPATPPNPAPPTDPSKLRLTLDLDPKKPVDAATRDSILNNIMETGIPCQETATGNGPEGSQKTQLEHRQRGFDFYSWLTFIALNSPADGRTRIDKSLPNTKTKWEDRANFKQLLDVMLLNGEEPEWDKKSPPPGCESEFKPESDMGIEMINESYDQPFKTGPLIDQQGSYALFDILMNKEMFDYIKQHKLYSKTEQQSEANSRLKVDFPAGVNFPKDGTPGHPGGIIIKVSWKILDSEAEKRRFHTVDAVISMPRHGSEKPPCLRKTLGLVGFHVMHKTETRLQWIWTSFEHVDNVPEQQEIKSRKLKRSYSFYNPACTTCPVNQTPPRPWEPKQSLGLKFHSPFKSQIVRMTPLTDDTKKMNKKFQEVVRGTVWENYMLLSTQWPSDFRCAGKQVSDPKPELAPNTDLEKEPDMNCAPAPTFLANSTLETYSQGDSPLASSSCMACHGNATSYQAAPRDAETPGPDGKPDFKFFNQTDFTFMLEKAR
jgi:hypothetical protein